MPDRAEDIYYGLFLEVGILAQLSRAMFEARLPPGFMLPQFSVLNHLVRVKDGRTPLELARAFQVPKTSMTHSLAVLERHWLVEMRPNARDGRSKCVFLTEAGREFRLRALAAIAPDMGALAEHFPADRLAGIIPVLTELRQVMDALRDTEPR
jgi:DNA-binding MarR family transcriptional regulator